MGLATHWWFWCLAAAFAAGSLVLSRRYPELVLRARRLALHRRLVEVGPGQALRPPSSAGHDPSWLVFPLALWLGASPWIWGYDGEPGAIASDLVTAAAVLLVALAAIVLPALWTLETLVAIAALVAAQRQLTRGSGAIGRLRR